MVRARRNKEACEDIANRTIITAVICIAGVIGIVIALGLAMLKAIVLSGDLASLLIMLMVTLFMCVPSISMYGTYKYAECLNNELVKKIIEWLSTIENRGGE